MLGLRALGYSGFYFVENEVAVSAGCGINVGTLCWVFVSVGLANETILLEGFLEA